MNAEPTRVPVVEDDTDTRAVCALLLRRWGYDVREAATGPNALVIAANWRPDIVLLDIGLPGMDGYEVGRQLRQLGTGELNLVALSGSDPEQPQRVGVAFDLCVLNPWDSHDLRARLARRAGDRRDTVSENEYED
jgi:CheY-like chemotaxis protein